MPFSLNKLLGFLNSLFDYGLKDEGQEDALKISRQLRGHPLTISYAASLIYNIRISLKEYSEMFEKGIANQILF